MARAIGQIEPEAAGGARVCFTSSRYKRCAVASRSGQFFLVLAPDVYDVALERAGRTTAFGLHDYSRKGWHREDLRPR